MAEVIERWHGPGDYAGRVQFPYLDEFIADNVDIHYEAMGDAQFWMSVTCRDTGRMWHLNFGAVSTRVKGYAIAEEDIPRTPGPARTATRGVGSVESERRDGLARARAAHVTTVSVMGGWSSRNGKDSDRCYGWRCTCGAHSPGAFNVDLTRTEVDASRFSHEADALAPLLDEWSAQDRAEALREAAEAWGGGMVGKWLNDRAGDIPRNGPAEVWDEGFNAGFLIGGEAARREPTSRIFNPYRAALAPSTPRRAEPGVQGGDGEGA